VPQLLIAKRYAEEVGVIEVTPEQRVDDHTVIFKVKWEDLDTKEWLAAFVYVEADLDEVRSDQITVPPAIRSRAIDAAREVAKRFYDAAEEALKA
jgi:hypothetical protein